MVFSGISYLAVIVAAIAGFVFGSVWYGVLGKQWMAALGKPQDSFKPSPGPFITAIVAQLVMAYFLAGLIGHMGDVTLMSGVISAFFVWVGFIVTTMTVNHRFQQAPWSLTWIDGGHWLGVILVMGIVIGLFGS